MDDDNPNDDNPKPQESAEWQNQIESLTATIQAQNTKITELEAKLSKAPEPDQATQSLLLTLQASLAKTRKSLASLKQSSRRNPSRKSAADPKGQEPANPPKPPVPPKKPRVWI